MIAVQIADIGSFMTKFLRSEIFDPFEFMEGTLQTRITYVVDYIRLKTPNKRLNKLVFNLSDIYVLIGAVILFITSRLHKDEQ